MLVTPTQKLRTYRAGPLALRFSLEMSSARDLVGGRKTQLDPTQAYRMSGTGLIDFVYNFSSGVAEPEPSEQE